MATSKASMLPPVVVAIVLAAMALHCNAQDLTPTYGSTPTPTPRPKVDRTFPFCNCNSHANATMFKLSDTESGPASPAGLPMTCFTLIRNPNVDDKMPCSNTTTVSKVEFVLDWFARLSMGYIYVSVADNIPPVKMAPSWDPKHNVLKVVPDGGFSAASLPYDPRICIEHRGNSTINTLLLSPGKIHYAVFSADRKCCPTAWSTVMN